MKSLLTSVKLMGPVQFPGKLLLAVALAAACTSPASAVAQPTGGAEAGDLNSWTVDDLAWLAGTWEGHMGVGDGLALAQIQYLPPQGGAIIGSFRLTKDGRVLVVEIFSLLETPTGLEMRLRHFDDDLTPWEEGDPIILELEEVSDTLFTFRNHVHDSPRWSYFAPLDSQTMRAWSEIYNADGEESVIDITFRRVGAVQSERGSPGRSPSRPLAAGFEIFEPLLGSWTAGNDSFTTTLEYRVGPTGHWVDASNVLYDGSGRETGRYQGTYVLDPVDGSLRFTSVSDGGELHIGSAHVRDGELWHVAEVRGGAIEGYRSVVGKVGGGVFEYRAVYDRSASEQQVSTAQPLIYRRPLPEEGRR